MGGEWVGVALWETARVTAGVCNRRSIHVCPKMLDLVFSIPLPVHFLCAWRRTSRAVSYFFCVSARFGRAKNMKAQKHFGYSVSENTKSHKRFCRFVPRSTKPHPQGCPVVPRSTQIQNSSRDKLPLPGEDQLRP